MRAVDVHGFGGGFTLGTVQAGFDLIAKKSRGVGFGVLNVLANRRLVPGSWDVQSEDPTTWTLEDDVDLVFGNPPCSGFSTLSPKAFRGVDSKANDYMWEFVGYAARVKPRMAIFESVQQTFSQGIKLMQSLRTFLEEESGCRYDLVHVLHNNAGLGGCSIRKRYFWVVIRDGAPFGVEPTATRFNLLDNTLHDQVLTRVPTFNDVLMDLEPLGLSMHDQPYRGIRSVVDEIVNETTGEFELHHRAVEVDHASWWARQHMHDGTGMVDGHDVARSPTLDRIQELMRLEEWRQGERMSDVLKRFQARTGEMPDGYKYMTKKPVLDDQGNVKHGTDGKPLMEAMRKDQRLIETDFAMGHNQPARWKGDRMARVITGGAVHLIVHPTLPRTLTQREAARIQGFPDAWKIYPVRHAPDLGPGWGKGVPVHAGRWVARWAKASMEDQPGSVVGDLIGERERVINLTRSHKALTDAIGDPG